MDACGLCELLNKYWTIIKNGAFKQFRTKIHIQRFASNNLCRQMEILARGHKMRFLCFYSSFAFLYFSKPMVQRLGGNNFAISAQAARHRFLRRLAFKGGSGHR